MGSARLRDLVVLLPGITGSVLQKDGRDLWGISGQSAWSLLSSAGLAMNELALAADDPETEDVGDGITAPRLIPDATIIPGLMKIDCYSATARMIRDRFLVEEGTIQDDKPANFIQFPYDWRRDNRFTARRLQRLIQQRLPQWREYSGASDAKVILLAHSMGGLVARYYLDCLGGWPDCRLLITLGTPYRGAPSALDSLVNGYRKLWVDLTSTLRTFTSMYQLLPIYRSLLVGVATRRVAEAEVPGVAVEQAKDALAFHHEIMNAVERNREEDEEYRLRGYRVIPFVGIRQPTQQSGQLSSREVTVGFNLPEGIDPLLEDGDGTVPRLSAIPVELSDEYRQTFFPERHGSLQRNDMVLTQVRSIIEQSQVVGLSAIRGADVDAAVGAQPAISLSLEDLYLPGEPVRFQVRLINVPGGQQPPEGRIETVAGTVVQTKTFSVEGDSWVAEVVGLPPGVYRLEVRAGLGGGAPAPGARLVRGRPGFKLTSRRSTSNRGARMDFLFGAILHCRSRRGT